MPGVWDGRWDVCISVVVDGGAEMGAKVAAEESEEGGDIGNYQGLLGFANFAVGIVPKASGDADAGIQ